MIWMVNKHYIISVILLFLAAIILLQWDCLKKILLKLFKSENSNFRNKECVTVCINCGSIDVRNDLSRDMIAWEGSTRMECVECGYFAVSFPKMPKSDLKGFRKLIKNRTEEEKIALIKASNIKLIKLGQIFKK